MLFTSHRERRLWFWTLTVLVAIYSSLGPARTLVDALRERDLLDVAFWVMVVAVGGAVVVRSAKRRPGWGEVGVAFGVALVYGFVFLRIENPAERTHLIEYGVVAALLHQALLERSSNGRRVPWPAALAVLLTAVAGLVDEGIQAVMPSRFFDWNDVFFNALAGFMVVAARLALAPQRGPGWRLWFLWLVAGAIGWGWSMDAGTFGEPRRIEILASLPAVDVPLFWSVAVGAIVVAVLQWLILRRYLTGSSRWVWAGIGAAAGYGLVVWAGGLIDTDVGLVAGAALYGVVAGVLQWLVLRGTVARAGWWVLASSVGWVATVPIGDAMGPPGWAVYGAITGTALVQLLRRP